MVLLSTRPSCKRFKLSLRHSFLKILVFFFQGDRFGGALDGAARMFSHGLDSGMAPMEFVNDMRKKGQLIMGIGHRVKSVRNLWH